MTSLFMMQLDDYDPEERPSAFLDQIAERGVGVADARTFATWLEGVFARHAEAVKELREVKQDYQALADKHPEQRPIPVAESFYHLSQPKAQAIAEQMMKDDPRIERVKVEFEPNNGWVIVLGPARHDLSCYEGVAEVRDGRKAQKPIGRVPYAPVGAGNSAGAGKAPREPGAAPTAPIKGATAKVWEIAEQTLSALGKLDRTAIIKACEAAGINAATAATQYSKWKKAKGL